MKILQVCNKPPYPPHDGGSLAMFNLARSLIRLGHAITVLTMYSKKHMLTDQLKQEFANLVSLFTIYVDTTPQLTGILRNLIFSRKPYNAGRFISKSFERELIRLLNTESYDIVQIEGLYLTPYIPVIRKHSKALISLRAHNVEHEIWERIADTEENHFRKQYFRLLANRIKRFEYENLNSYDLLVPITNRDLEQFSAMGNIRPALACPAGIDIDQNDVETQYAGVTMQDTPTENFSLFFLGSLDWIPNQEGMLWFISDIFPVLHQNYPGLILHIAGRNAPDDLIKKIRVPGVVFYGEIDDSREFMKTKSVMVAPCFSGSGMRVKIVEAMAAGKPVVTTPIGAEGLTVKHDENILIATNAIDFIQHIERLMKYPELSLRIVQNARKFVSDNYNNMVIASALAGFYKAHLK